MIARVYDDSNPDRSSWASHGAIKASFEEPCCQSVDGHHKPCLSSKMHQGSRTSLRSSLNGILRAALVISLPRSQDIRPLRTRSLGKPETVFAPGVRTGS